MATFEKHYIGKGTQLKNLDIIKVVIPVNEALAATFEKNGITYISVEVARMKNPDKFGRTHTVYYQNKVSEKSEPVPTQSNGNSNKRKKPVTA